jgi:hypothetical protein
MVLKFLRRRHKSVAEPTSKSAAKPTSKSAAKPTSASRKSVAVANRRDEESVMSTTDWIPQIPPANDLSNPDPILRLRTIDTVSYGKESGDTRSLDHILEDDIEYKTLPSFAVPIDSRDDIPLDDDTHRALAESKLSGVMQMVQSLLGGEPMPSLSRHFEEQGKDDICNEQAEEDFAMPFIVFDDDEDTLTSFNNEVASSATNSSTSSTSSDRNSKDSTIDDDVDDSSTLSGSASSGYGILRYDGCYDDHNPDIFDDHEPLLDLFRLFDVATDSFIKLFERCEKGSNVHSG